MENYKKLENKRGFTLIEVMIVASIIALLAAIIFANFHASRVKAAEAKAIQEARSLQTAVELYRSDNGQYPVNKGTSADLPNLTTQLVPKYIPEVPYKVPSAEYDNFCPNVQKIRFISDGNIAADDNFEIRCGPGTVPAGAVILILDKNKDSAENVSIGLQPHARIKGTTNVFDQFVLAVYTGPFESEPQCTDGIVPSGGPPITDSGLYAYRCLPL